MKRQHAYIKGISGPLVSPVDPPDIGARVGGPLEVTWRKHNGKYYYVVFNMSDRTLTGQRITLHNAGASATASVYNETRSETISGGVITDDFGAYGVHVYVVDAPTTATTTASAAAPAGVKVQREASTDGDATAPVLQSVASPVFVQPEPVAATLSLVGGAGIDLTDGERDILA
jgi:hypothetical protein